MITTRVCLLVESVSLHYRNRLIAGVFSNGADTSSPQKQTNKPALLVLKAIDKLNFTVYDFRLHCMKNKLDISMKVNKKSSNFKIKN